MQMFETVPVSVLGKEFTPTPEFLTSNLRLLDRLPTLLLCAKLNLITSDGTSNNHALGQVEALRLLNQDRLLTGTSYQKIRRYLLEKAQTDHPAYAINRPGLLELMRWVAKNCDDKRIVQLPASTIAEAFISSLLICAEWYGERELGPTLTGEGSKEEQRFAFLPGIRRAAIWAGAFRHPSIALGRTQVLLIEQFFDHFDNYKNVFAEATGLTIREYLMCASAIVARGFLLDAHKSELRTLSGCFEIPIDRLFAGTSAMKATFGRYVSLMAQTADELTAGFGGAQPIDKEAAFDFRGLRRKPLLRVEDRVIVIDQRLFVESFSAGPLFVLTGALRSQQPLNDYGVACQNYAFSLLRRTNSRFSTEAAAPHLENEPNGTTRPINDVLIGTDSSAALCEAKGAWLNDNVLYEADANAFWQEIERKYGISIDPKTKAEKRKGIAQLADVITELQNHTLEGTNGAAFVNNVEALIPVLVVQDPLMVEGFFPHQLALNLQKLLGRDGALPETGFFQFDRFRVHSLITLSLDDLEALETVKPEVPIMNLLLEYSAEVPKRGDTFTAFLNHRKPSLNRLGDDQLLLPQATKALVSSLSSEFMPSGS